MRIDVTVLAVGIPARSDGAATILKMAGEPLDPGQAKTRLNECVRDGSIRESTHFLQRLEQRGMTMQNVYQVCRSGSIKTPPELHARSGDWNYRIEGMTTNLTYLKVIFAFDRHGRAVFVSVFYE